MADENSFNFDPELIQRAEEFKNIFQDVRSTVNEFNRELERAGGQAADTRGTFQSLASSASKVAMMQYEVAESAKGTAKAEAESAKIASRIEQLKAQQVLLQDQAKTLSGEAAVGAQLQAENIANAVREAEILNGIYVDLAKQGKELDKNTRFFRGMETFVKSIPGVKAFSGPFEGATKAAREALVAGESSQKAFSIGGKALLNGFKKMLGPVAIITGIVKVIQFVVSLFVSAQKSTVEIAKNLNITRESAEVTRQRFLGIAASSSNILVNSKELISAQQELNTALGATVFLSGATLENQVFLTKNLGIAGDQAGRLGLLFDAFGKNSLEVTDQIIEQNNQFALQNGILIPTRELLSDIAGTSGEIAGYFGFNTQELAEGVRQTRRFGVTLQQASSIAKGLLDFEQSIGSQLEAELLTGQQFNFELARSKALQGDIAGATSDVLSQIQNLTEEQRRSPIIMESIAKATGLSAEEINNAFLKQQRLTRATKDYVQELRRAGDQEKAQLAERLGLQGASRAEIEKTLTTQEAFRAATEKAKDQLTRLVDGGYLNQLTDIIINFTNNIASGKSIFRALLSRNEPITTPSDTVTSEGEMQVKDFVIKSLPEDTVIAAGGTNLGNTDEMISLLKELVTATKQGKVITLDKTVVGETMNRTLGTNTYAI